MLLLVNVFIIFAGPFEVNGYHVNVSSRDSFCINKDDDLGRGKRAEDRLADVSHTTGC